MDSQHSRNMQLLRPHNRVKSSLVFVTPHSKLRSYYRFSDSATSQSRSWSNLAFCLITRQNKTIQLITQIENVPEPCTAIRWGGESICGILGRLHVTITNETNKSWYPYLRKQEAGKRQHTQQSKTQTAAIGNTNGSLDCKNANKNYQNKTIQLITQIENVPKPCATIR